MKLISLNLWAGREYDTLMNWISKEAESTDLFCFQEVFDTNSDETVVSEFYRANLFSELDRILPEHSGYFAPTQDQCGFDGLVDFNLSWGLAMFAREEIMRSEIADQFVYRSRNSREEDNTTIARNLQYGTFLVDGSEVLIANLHGLWNGKGKTDTNNRIAQSKNIRRVLDEYDGHKILCGDFNLNPDTRSLAILKDGMVDLIEGFGVESTRSKLYKKAGKFADYTLVSPKIKVKSFEVPYTEISDHLPMVLDFEV